MRSVSGRVLMLLPFCLPLLAGEGTASGPPPAPRAGAAPGAKLRSAADLQGAAAKAGAALSLPRFERTPEEVEAAVKVALAEASRRLDALAAQDHAQATFESTVAALDDILYPVSLTGNRIYLMQESRPEATMRKACAEQVKAVQQWQVGVTYREDVYQAVKAFADAYEAGRRGALAGEDLKLYRDTMRDYRRAGLHLDKPTRDQVEALLKELARLSTDFSRNIGEAKAVVTFAPEELAGVPEAFLATVRTAGGNYDVLANVTPHYLAVAENARSEAARRKMELARFTLAQKENAGLLDRIVALRDQVAALLGYASWADYQIEPRMAKTAARATAFLEDLSRGLDPKLEAERAECRRMKARDTGETDARIFSWDWRYYQNQVKKERYTVDAEALRAFFPFEHVRAGMFEIYERIFGLRFEPLANPDPWAEGVELFAASDAATGEPLGLFYMDNFPRDGKYNHYAQFGIVDGKKLPEGLYQRPVVALVCNFPAPAPGRPSLLSHDEVETLFHEFGHALHSLLTRARYFQFAGTSVPRDFVEAPSQMLENWVWDATVLNRFAGDYREPARKIDPALIQKMKEAKLATSGTFYRRQIGLALADLTLHAAPAGKKDAQAIINRTFSEVFIPPPEGTHFGAYWGHLTGYDAGYYGYLWAEAIAADMATAFAQAPEGYFDAGVGRRLRDEVYAVGGSREAEESIRLFLGRERSLDPFLKEVGLK